MSFHGVPLTDTAKTRLDNGAPELAIAELPDAKGLEPGRPVRLVDRGAGVVAETAIANPENGLMRLFLEELRGIDPAFFRRRVDASLALRRAAGLPLAQPGGVLSPRERRGRRDVGAGGRRLRAVRGGDGAVARPARARAPARAGRAGAAARRRAAAAGAVLKTRLKGSGNAPERAKDDVVGETPPDKLVVRESGVPYEVHLRGGINVGLFTDMREHRAGLARFVRGKRVLNTFAYTGALSVAAARAGAAAVTSVDLAAGPLAWARANFALSGLDAAAHRWEVSDVFRFLDGERERRAAYDVIILDPPTVSGARASLWAQKRDYPDLIAAACALLPRGGRPPVDLVEHPPRPQRAQARRRRHRPRPPRRARPRARRPAARLPHPPHLAGRALPRGLPAVRVVGASSESRLAGFAPSQGSARRSAASCAPIPQRLLHLVGQARVR